VRAGRVRRIQRDRIVLEHDEIPARGKRFYVDCTADGLPRRTPRPIFEPGRITIQTIREASPPFNAALIGHLEVTRDDIAAQLALAPTNSYPDTAEDWIRTRHIGLIAQRAWNQDRDVLSWMEGARLNIAAGLGNQLHKPDVSAAVSSMLEHTDAAIENLARLRSQLGDQVDVTA